MKMNKYQTTTCGSQLVDMLEDWNKDIEFNKNILNEMEVDYEKNVYHYFYLCEEHVYEALLLPMATEFIGWLEAKDKRRFRSN